ncbi:hypothetical protein ACIPLC_26855 [Kitasatospora sp. NPDC086801]|uniref:hypothetical protein n=1 Tax=Kitasatospora sp. NPDC086801 TaxID=3364066 RepID=UPI00382F8ADD
MKKTHQGRDYVRKAEISGKTLGFAWIVMFGSGLATAWGIEPPLYPDGDTGEHLYVPAGLFTAVPSWGRPAPNEVTWVLDLPAVVEKGPDPAVPRLTSHAEPPAHTTSVIDRTITVPYFMVKDTGRDEKWKLEHSPFYKIRRKRHYELALFRDNQQGSASQADSQSITTGVSRESTETYSAKTGISVSVEVGVELEAAPFGMGAKSSVRATVSASVELGYEHRSGVTTMASKTITHSLAIPPKCSGALWMERHELFPIRRNGDMISADAKLSFRTVYYHTGQFPPASAAGERVVYAELDDNGQPLPFTFGIPVQGIEPQDGPAE